jgi:hypothetical protein
MEMVASLVMTALQALMQRSCQVCAPFKLILPHI